MISYDEAIKIINQYVPELETEIITIENALNRISANEVHSNFPMPRFDNSAMDGFAFNFEQFQSISENNPFILEVIGVVAAGESFKNKTAIQKNQAIEIMTGAPIPEFCNAVIPIEDVTIKKLDNKKFIEIKRPVKKHENIRFSGEDYKENQIILAKNDIISHDKIMVLSSFGIDKIHVKKKIKIAIFSTGKEVIDNNNHELKSDQIFNSNTPYLKSLFTDIPADVTIFNTIPDKKENFFETINTIKENDYNIIISTGAVSKGKWDLIPECLKEIGAEILFHKVRIKPGKPILFAKLLHNLYYFGLPGNPISCAVGFRFFIMNFIQNMLNIKRENLYKVRLESSFSKKNDMTLFLKGKLFVNEQAVLNAIILNGQESFKMNSLTLSNCWIILPEGKSSYEINDYVYSLPLKANTGIFQ